MTLEATPGSVDTLGNLRILWVPADGIADVTAPTVTELTAATVKPITYSLTTSGWNPARSQDSGTDDRLTLTKSFESAGKVTDTLEVQYVYGADDDVADPALVEGTKGFVVERVAVANEQEIAADDVVNIYPVECGVKRPDAPAANAKFTKTQKLFIVAPGVQDAVKVVAGA